MNNDQNQGSENNNNITSGLNFGTSSELKKYACEPDA